MTNGIYVPQDTDQGRPLCEQGNESLELVDLRCKQLPLYKFPSN
jgi:hypothetical protein